MGVQGELKERQKMDKSLAYLKDFLETELENRQESEDEQSEYVTAAERAVHEVHELIRRDAERAQ